MKNPPKISIITPSYNQGNFIEDTILSVIGQRYPNLEYIIIDGGSTDNTVDIIRQYEIEISYWISEPDKGQSHAVNKGFEKATGEILMWLNSDDILMPNILHYIAACVQQSQDGIYFGNCIHFNNGEGLITRGSDVVQAYNKLKIEEIDFIIQPSSFWTRRVWNLVGQLREDMHFGFDWEWFIRAKLANVAFFPLSKVISIYRIHDSHKTGVGGDKRRLELLSIFKQYSPRLAGLYERIMNSNNPKSSLINRIRFLFYAISCRLRKTPLSYAQELKILHPKDYENYTLEDIESVIKMM